MKNLMVMIMCLILVSCGGSPQPVRDADSLPLDHRYEELFSLFFEKTREKDYAGAYALMSREFVEKEPIGHFYLIIGQTGLTSFTRWKWTGATKAILGLFPSVTGVFLTPDEEKHELTFTLAYQGEDFRIAEISETISVEDLQKRVPDDRKLELLVKKDLKSLLESIRKGNAESIFTSLSQHGRASTSQAEVAQLLQDFKNQQITLLPENALFEISTHSPYINDAGAMVVELSFPDLVQGATMTLTYDYEWQWKLGGFSYGQPRPEGYAFSQY